MKTKHKTQGAIPFIIVLIIFALWFRFAFVNEVYYQRCNNIFAGAQPSIAIRINQSLTKGELPQFESQVQFVDTCYHYLLSADLLSDMFWKPYNRLGILSLPQ